jgi:hypothetical protein
MQFAKSTDVLNKADSVSLRHCRERTATHARIRLIYMACNIKPTTFRDQHSHYIVEIIYVYIMYHRTAMCVDYSNQPPLLKSPAALFACALASRVIIPSSITPKRLKSRGFESHPHSTTLVYVGPDSQTRRRWADDPGFAHDPWDPLYLTEWPVVPSIHNEARHQNLEGVKVGQNSQNRGNGLPANLSVEEKLGKMRVGSGSFRR